jgi:hypothetical protein
MNMLLSKAMNTSANSWVIAGLFDAEVTDLLVMLAS